MEQRGQQERLHLKSLRSKVEGEGDVSFLQAFLMPIQRWVDKKLGDYHMNFNEGSATMEKVVAVAMITRRLLLEEPETTPQSMPISDRDQMEIYISSSIKSVFARTFQVVERLDMLHGHPLALLAEELKKLLKRDSEIFMPILSQRHPQATIVSASIVHRLYGNKLKPFLESAEHLSEDAISVFPAAESLEQFIMALIMSVCEEENAEIFCKKLNLYQIESKSGTLVLRWLNSQLGRILGWVERAIQQEGSETMEKVVAIAMIRRRLLLEEPETTLQAMPISDRDQIEIYISSSIKSVFARTLQVVERLDMSHGHPLALLAEELKKLLKGFRNVHACFISEASPGNHSVSITSSQTLWQQIEAFSGKC